MAEIITLNPDFISGRSEAIADVERGDIYDLDDALSMFQIDPADTEFQRGYQAGLVKCYQQRRGA